MSRNEPIHTQPAASLGPFYVWRRGWPLPPVAARLDGPLVVEAASPASQPVADATSPDDRPVADQTSPDDPLASRPAPPLGSLGDIPADEVARRLADGHTRFTARVDGELAAYGWSASERAHIGGLDLYLAIPPDERYLWDFVTLPAYRGRGIYPLLLQDVLRRQAAVADGFWIGHEPSNVASRRGILKAGFRVGGHIWRLPDASLAVVGAPDVDPELAHRGAAVLDLPFLAAPPGRP